MNIEANRAFFLSELRSGKYVKGTIVSDETTGKPVFLDGNYEGSCACAVMHDLFFDYEGTQSSRNYLRALDLTPIECRYIQRDLNDTSLTFNEIADKIESEVFNGKFNIRKGQ